MFYSSSDHFFTKRTQEERLKKENAKKREKKEEERVVVSVPRRYSHRCLIPYDIVALPNIYAGDLNMEDRPMGSFKEVILGIPRLSARCSKNKG